MGRVRGIWIAAIAAATTIAFAALPALAGAANDSALYAPDLNARSFATGDGGWEKGTGSTGLCLPPLSCPAVSSGFVAGGGADGGGDGYIRTRIGALTGVGSESRGVLRSPLFTYKGNKGDEPDSLDLRVSHLARIGSLLSVAGNQVNYTVELVDQSRGGNAIRVIDSAGLSPDESWTRSTPAGISPGALRIGDQYRIRIITRFVYGAQVIPGGQVGYDDVMLVASGDGTANGPPAAGGNGTGPGGGSAVFDGRNLFIKLRCFGVHANGRCWDRATALAGKHGKRYTFPIQRKVKAKKGKVIRARVRFRFRQKLEQSRTVTLRSVLAPSRGSASKTTRYTKLKLIKRG